MILEDERYDILTDSWEDFGDQQIIALRASTTGKYKERYIFQIGGMNPDIDEDIFQNWMLMIDTEAQNPKWEFVKLKGTVLLGIYASIACVPFDFADTKNKKYLVLGGQRFVNIYRENLYHLQITEKEHASSAKLCDRFTISCEEQKATLTAPDRIYYNSYMYERGQDGNKALIVVGRHASHLFNQDMSYVASDTSRKYEPIDIIF